MQTFVALRVKTVPVVLCPVCCLITKISLVIKDLALVDFKIKHCFDDQRRPWSLTILKTFKTTFFLPKLITCNEEQKIALKILKYIKQHGICFFCIIFIKPSSFLYNSFPAKYLEPIGLEVVDARNFIHEADQAVRRSSTPFWVLVTKTTNIQVILKIPRLKVFRQKRGSSPESPAYFPTPLLLHQRFKCACGEH